MQVRGFACDCAYPECCDSQAAPLPATRLALKQQGGGQALGGPPESAVLGEREAAGSTGDSLCSSSDAALVQLEAEHVVKVYDAIAQHFSATRFAIWPKVREFIETLPSGAIVADVGCGNGKYFGVRGDIAVIGSDRSEGLASVAARRLQPVGVPGSHFSPGTPPGADVLVADGLHLPYREGSCDAALCIAVLHHISSPGRRTLMLTQLLALLRPGGRAIVSLVIGGGHWDKLCPLQPNIMNNLVQVTVWATEQEEPDKTIKKWTRIPHSDSPMETPSVASTQPSSLPNEAVPAAAAPSSTDFFVPWNLPCHRAEAQGALNKKPLQKVRRWVLMAIWQLQ